MHGRGEKTRALSAQFAENAKKNPGNHEFDLNQSRMLDYQHSLWHEVGNLVDKLIKRYE
jgi:quinol monooxygenase YgiN